MSRSKRKAVGWHRYRIPNIIGEGLIPYTNTAVKMLPEYFSILNYCYNLGYIEHIIIILFSMVGKGNVLFTNFTHDSNPLDIGCSHIP